jgi:hypothetical protein
MVYERVSAISEAVIALVVMRIIMVELFYDLSD